MSQIKAQIEPATFFQADIRTGTIVAAEPNKKARKPSYVLRIDFGDIGEKVSSAQITDHYDYKNLVGRQVVAVVNFPPLRVGIKSEVLILGAVEENGKVVLIQPDRKVKNGLKIG
ncbi:MAG: tRNA-binding protein [Bacteroidota bacterium]